MPLEAELKRIEAVSTVVSVFFKASAAAYRTALEVVRTAPDRAAIVVELELLAAECELELAKEDR